MNSVKRHYDDLLATHYSWMSGLPLLEKAAAERSLLERLGADGSGGGPAVDLGCGPGYQSIALADLGYAPVLAIDTCEALLRELEAAKGQRSIDAIAADLSEFRRHVAVGSASIVVCMGDTLAHLPSRSDVSTLFDDAREALRPGGRLVLTFRSQERDLAGLDRFIPVRADADRIMLCALEFEPDRITVNDLIYHRRDGEWVLQKSSYQKLRLTAGELVSELEQCGFSIDHDERGSSLNAISARKR